MNCSSKIANFSTTVQVDFPFFSAYGGAISHSKSVFINRCLFHHNSASKSSFFRPIYVICVLTSAWGGASNSLGSTTVINSTFRHNRAKCSLSLIPDDGGAIFNDRGTLNIFESLFFSNTAGTTFTFPLYSLPRRVWWIRARQGSYFCQWKYL